MYSSQVFNLLTHEYSLILATTEQHYQIIQNIRKNIILTKYPEFEKTKEYNEYLFNQDDKQSFIYLLKHNDSKHYVGSVRIFFINTRTPIQLLPMQKDLKVNNIDNLTQDLPIVEISRGALITNLPKHKILNSLQLRTYLTYGLMVATRINFILNHYSRVLSIMEPSLHRILQRQKVNFKQIGDPIDYFGIRTPYAIERKKLLRDTEETMGQITRYYLKQLCQNPEPFWQFIDNNPYLERSDIQLDRICQLFKEYGDDVDLELLLGEKEIITEV